MDEPSLFDLSGPSGSDGLSDEQRDEIVATTWGVGELHRAIEAVLDGAFGGEIWIEGEIRNLKRSPKKHAYFDLVDSDSAGDQYPPLLSVTLFARERQIVNRFLSENGGNVRISDGLRVRIRGSLGTYSSRSSLQLRMTGIDPTFTLGVLDQQRERVLAALSADNLLDSNSRLPLSRVPTRIALVTSVGSAAHADALEELRTSGLGLQISVLDARVQGADSERTIVSALHTAAHLSIDVILVVRGGGARTDLAVFDVESVARAIAGSAVPVITGIGHEVDSSIADIVAHTSHKTPTAAAASVVNRVRQALVSIESDWANIAASSVAKVEAIDRSLTRTGTAVRLGSERHLVHERQRVEHLRHRITLVVPRSTAALATALDDRARRVARSANHQIELSRGRLDALDAQTRVHDPKLALARGWSMTRTASGRLLRSVDDIQPGDVLESVLADGVVRSVVESTAPEQASDGPENGVLE
ncbi:MAG TPA: exodeoxyribonuclease VII large subunit [Microthrixaceae bacterium]|nr:exodeoxyribonuclease VII large subunit [Microthrixaceae bacterium]